jgi:hypothetical protein
MIYEGPCYGCKNDKVDMKHPVDAGKYRGGHDPSWPRRHCCGGFPVDLPTSFDAMMEAKERIRNLFQVCTLCRSAFVIAVSTYCEWFICLGTYCEWKIGWWKDCWLGGNEREVRYIGKASVGMRR